MHQTKISTSHNAHILNCVFSTTSTSKNGYFSEWVLFKMLRKWAQFFILDFQVVWKKYFREYCMLVIDKTIDIKQIEHFSFYFDLYFYKVNLWYLVKSIFQNVPESVSKKHQENITSNSHGNKHCLSWISRTCRVKEILFPKVFFSLKYFCVKQLEKF